MAKRPFATIIFVTLVLLSCRTAYADPTVRGLVVLIDFSDQPANISVNRADKIINGVGYTEPTVTRSLRDYWLTQSRGKVVMTHKVIGYFRAPQTAAWYNSQPFDAYILLLQQALNSVVATRPDFDWNALSLANGRMNRNGTEKGTFLSINFVTTAWIPGTGGTHWLPWTAPNGVPTQQVTGSTFISPWDSDVNLFWLTHEQGHSIWGWPDTYDTTAQSYGTGLYSLMSGNQSTGDIEPVGAPFLLAEQWVNAIDINGQTIVLTPDGNSIARYRNPLNSREYFVVEARTNTAPGNLAFPVPLGLLIWHVDEAVTTGNTRPEMTSQQHYQVSVEQADGLFDLERFANPGDLGDIYVPGNVFSDWVTPNANWWDGSASGLNIDRIQIFTGDRNIKKISFRTSIAK